jgi:hypothetical protein
MLYDQLIFIETLSTENYWENLELFHPSINFTSIKNAPYLEFTLPSPTPFHYIEELPKLTFEK